MQHLLLLLLLLVAGCWLPVCDAQVLRSQGISVLTVREILAFGVEERMGARVELEELAASTLTYKLAEGETEGNSQHCCNFAGTSLA
jgi:hypothetical protein